MEENKTEPDSVEVIGTTAGLLAATEVGFGSLLHGLKIPLSGQILSLNQGFVLSRSVLKNSHMNGVRRIPAQASLVTSMLKSLSPAGKKLTPMLAISVQGFLHGIGIFIFGPNLFGVLVGMSLLSLWAYIQPLFIYYLMFGEDLIFMGEYYSRKLSKVFNFDPQDVLYILLAVILTKVILSLAVGVAAALIPDIWYGKWEATLLSKINKKKLETSAPKGSAIKLALKDLFNPLFIVTYLITISFFYFVKSPFTPTLWIALRPLIVGFILFYLVRRLPLDRILKNETNSPFKASLKKALLYLKAL
ncbi:MAG: hypothetical protein ACJAT2_000628 [Bacteriovoracaceae bacterium]|jgi:hypothetical protein